jgi:hypothetical protein
MLVDKLLGTLAASEKFAVQLNPISPLPAAATLYGGAYYRAAGLAREQGPHQEAAACVWVDLAVWAP